MDGDSLASFSLFASAGERDQHPEADHASTYCILHCNTRKILLLSWSHGTASSPLSQPVRHIPFSHRPESIAYRVLTRTAKPAAAVRP
jgi:hypothetical protein